MKCATREKRGFGNKTLVLCTTKIPKNWQEFLRLDANKTELFHFLADEIAKLAIPDKLILGTYDERINSSTVTVEFNTITPCNHEEADTRLILHCYHAALHGCKEIVIRTVTLMLWF